MYWSRNMHEKHHVKPHIYCFVIFCKQFGYVFGTNMIVQEMLTLWSTCIQDGRAPPKRQTRNYQTGSSKTMVRNRP